MRENKGLSDRELVTKYESGTIDLTKVLQKVISEPQLINKKKNTNSKIKHK